MRGISFKFAVFAVASLLAAEASAKALRVAVENVPASQQAMNSEVVIVGKVTEIEKEPTKATFSPGATDKVDYTVGVIKISDSIKGANGLTTIRVGFMQAAVAPVNQPNNKLRPMIAPAIARIPNATLTAEQEGCFFLTKHHDGDFYVMQQFGQPLDKKSPDFDKQIGTIKKTMKIYEDPKASLQAKDAADRQNAAIVLVQKYRTTPALKQATATTKIIQEPIDAEESKLILQSLSEMEWGKVDANGMGIQNSFYMLGLQPKDGWTQPKFVQGQDFNKIMGAAVKKWMTENAEKYRIQRYVVVK